METITIEQTPKLTIKDIAILPIETLLELGAVVDDQLVAAKKLHSLLNGAIAIRNLRNEKIKGYLL